MRPEQERLTLRDDVNEWGPHGLRPPDQSFLERLVAQASTDERIRGLFLGGSHATGTADAHSDLDLYLIIADAAIDSFRGDRHEFMHGLGDAVFLEEHEQFGFLMLLYMYADGVHGEIAVAPAKDLMTVHSGPYITLLDKDGLLGVRMFPPWTLEGSEGQDVTRRVLVWFWYDRRLLDVALARNRLWTAHYYLERCRQACVNLARLRDRPDVWPDGYEKLELAVEPAVLELLAVTVVPLERGAMVAAAEAVTAAYMDLGPEVAALQGVAFPERLVATVRDSLKCRT